jgi:hypothetical protein
MAIKGLALVPHLHTQSFRNISSFSSPFLSSSSEVSLKFSHKKKMLLNIFCFSFSPYSSSFKLVFWSWFALQECLWWSYIPLEWFLECSNHKNSLWRQPHPTRTTNLGWLTTNTNANHCCPSLISILSLFDARMKSPFRKIVNKAREAESGSSPRRSHHFHNGSQGRMPSHDNEIWLSGSNEEQGGASPHDTKVWLSRSNEEVGSEGQYHGVYG